MASKDLPGRGIKISNSNKRLRGTVNYVPIIAGVVLLLVLVGIGFFFGFSSYGKAVFAPPAKPIDLNALGTESFAVETVPEFEIKLTLSGAKNSEVFAVNQVLLSSGLLYYSVGLGGVEKAVGLLGPAMSESGNIYLNGDAVPDIAWKFSGGMLEVTNLNFIAPDYSSIIVLGKNEKGELKPVPGDAFAAEKNKPKVLYFMAASSSAPEVSAEWSDGTALAGGEFATYADLTNETATVMQFNWTPVEELPRGLIVTAIVGDKETVKEYLLGVNGVLVKLNNSAYPYFAMRKITDYKYVLEYVFKSTTQLQPFSLPCGQMDLKTSPQAKNIKKAYAFSKSSQQWMENVPSEFSVIAPKKGYLIELKNNSQLSFNVTCDMSGMDIDDWSALPSLNAGWNMFGIGGYKAISVDTLEEKLTEEGFTLLELYEVSTSNPNIKDVTQLSPGKVYWINLEES